MNKQFSIDIAKFLAKAKNNAEAVAKSASLQVLNGVDLRCPVDEGRLRANNNVAVGKVDSKSNYTNDPTGQQAQVRALQNLESFKSGDTIFITTNVEYAQVVEFGQYGNPPGSANGPKTRGGFSIQAPAGMYSVTATEFGKFISKAVKSLK